MSHLKISVCMVWLAVPAILGIAYAVPRVAAVERSSVEVLDECYESGSVELSLTGACLELAFGGVR